MPRTSLFVSSRRSSLASLDRHLRGRRYVGASFFILLDKNSYAHCLPRLVSSVSAFDEACFFEVPAGEQAKSLDVAEQLWHSLLESGADRGSVIVNLGGGALSDLGGFVAAGFKRGIRYINVPTTLLAMVDAAIGGKTAVNISDYKNQVGFFYPPEAVCIEPAFLSSLPRRQFTDGCFELLKSQLVGASDGRIDWDMFKPSSLSVEAVAEAARFKSAVCDNDPYDHGIRKILNFGHTFGHALESHFLHSVQPLSHGAAVGLGLWCEFYLSVRKLGLDDSLLSRYSKLLKSVAMVPHYGLQEVEDMLVKMHADKKNMQGSILCVLLKEVGVPVIDVELSDNEVRDTLLKLHNQLAD